ncbi:MAG: hypothetical protein LBK61_00610 [Spirochaetaceae bacterium]|nr:hypothetical protein [Spirochaetaceae bacterium]
MPLRGAKTRWVFIPLRIIPRFLPRISGVPLRGAKTFGFSSRCESFPDSCRESAAGRQNTAMRSAPAGGENPTGFHPIVKPVPDSCRGISGRQAEYRHAAAVLPLRARNAAA